jgi:signal transduction histidine kinase
MSSGRTEGRLTGLRLSPRSIRFRLTALFVLIFGASMLLFSALLYRAFLESQQTEFDASLYNYAVDVVEGVDVGFFGDLSLRSSVLSDRGKIFPFTLGRAFLEIRDFDGRVLARSRTLGASELPFDKEDVPALFRRGVRFRTLEPGVLPQGVAQSGSAYRQITYLVDKPAVPKLALQIAVPLAPLERERRNLRAFILVAIPLLLLAGAFGGLYVAGRALAPVRAMIDKASQLSASRLAERLPVPEVHDEMRGLAVAFNEVLSRLQLAFESQERFVADASHQLKTPLAVLRGELDVLRSRDRSPHEIHEFIASASQEIDYLVRLVEDLLILARVDAGKGSLMLTPVRVDEIAVESVARLERPASAKGIAIRVDLHGTGFEAQGDPDLLRSLVHNLVENAIKFSPARTTIELRVVDEGERVAIEVRDQGPGIPGEKLAAVFERFHRAESSDAGRVPGAGLGLAIARRIAEVHGGAVEAANRADGPGAIFTARIKKT